MNTKPRHRRCQHCHARNVVTERGAIYVCADCQQPARCAGCKRACSDMDLRYGDKSTANRCPECRAGLADSPRTRALMERSVHSPEARKRRLAREEIDRATAAPPKNLRRRACIGPGTHGDNNCHRDSLPGQYMCAYCRNIVACSCEAGRFIGAV